MRRRAIGCAFELDHLAAGPQLKPVSQSPLRVSGTGFRPGENVHLAVNGPETHTKDTRAEFNLSEIACG